MTVRGRGKAEGRPEERPAPPDRAPNATRSFQSRMAPFHLGLECVRATKPQRETDVVRRREQSEKIRTAELAAADMVSRVNASSVCGRCGGMTSGEQDHYSSETFVQVRVLANSCGQIV